MTRHSRAVGFVGLGNIGRAMAMRLVRRPGGVWVHDVAAEPVAELTAAGAGAVSTVTDLADCVDLVCVMVRDDGQVQDVVDQLAAAAPRDLVVAVHSTVAQHTPVTLENAAPRGLRIVDAPVSGGAIGAAAGSLAIMVGGSEHDYQVCAEPLSWMGSEVLHAGPLGAGTRMKLARNLLHFVSFTAATEAQRLAEAAGVDLTELGRVVRHTDSVTGGPGAIMHRDTTSAVPVDDFWFGVFDHVRNLGEKDLASALELAEELRVELPLARQALHDLAAGLGLAASDTAESQA